jgi:phage FluMu protein Com
MEENEFAATGDRRYTAAMELAEVTCPTCFEVFEVAVPHPDEMPTEVDYDCEVCCRPMIIVFTEDEVYAKGLGD